MKIQYFFAISELGPPDVGTVLLLELKLMAVAEPEESITVLLIFDGFVRASQTPVTHLFVFGGGFELDDSLGARRRVP